MQRALGLMSRLRARLLVGRRAGSSAVARRNGELEEVGLHDSQDEARAMAAEVHDRARVTCKSARHGVGRLAGLSRDGADGRGAVRRPRALWSMESDDNKQPYRGAGSGARAHPVRPAPGTGSSSALPGRAVLARAERIEEGIAAAERELQGRDERHGPCGSPRATAWCTTYWSRRWPSCGA